nr:putative Myb family transcription factor [Ipomoea batatas]
MMRSNGQRNGVRQYKKSALPRLQWTPELHEHFVDTVESLGGRYKATPKRIVQMMGVKGLKISHVKSHLQESQGSLNCEMTTTKAEEDGGGGPSDESFEQIMIPQSAYNNEDHRRQASPVKDDRNSHSGAASTDTVDLRHLHSTKDSEINLDLSISCLYW